MFSCIRWATSVPHCPLCAGATLCAQLIYCDCTFTYETVWGIIEKNYRHFPQLHTVFWAVCKIQPWIIVLKMFSRRGNAHGVSTERGKRQTQSGCHDNARQRGDLQKSKRERGKLSLVAMATIDKEGPAEKATSAPRRKRQQVRKCSIGQMETT